MSEQSRYAIRTAAFALVIQDQKVLLYQRNNSGYRDGEHGLPAGHIEIGETAPEAVLRELKEETGLTAKLEDIEIVHVSHNKDDLEYVNFFGRVKQWDGEPANVEPHTCLEVAWYPLDALPTTTIPYIRDALTRIDKGEMYSTWGYVK